MVSKRKILKVINREIRIVNSNIQRCSSKSSYLRLMTRKILLINYQHKLQ